ncbi:MAG TPA: hypothetical protein VHM91_10780 [Verrucomicrobiales bacterium]|jgi:RNA polymerase sigma-70 factor (ECF subfamily)|nr:hypothetical protein [Verrucomicrobiales bacterium]
MQNTVNEEDGFPEWNGWPETMETPEQALERSCRDFLPVIYRALRASGIGHEDAEDLAQEFAVNFVPGVCRFHGKFRHSRFNVIRQLQDFIQRRRRGDNGTEIPVVSLEEAPGENQPVTPATPDEIYDREWASTLMRRATSVLRRDYESRGRATLFDLIRPALTGTEPLPARTTIARAAGLPAAQVSVEVNRARYRLGNVLRHEVAAHVDSPVEVEDELRYVLAVLAHGQ